MVLAEKVGSCMHEGVSGKKNMGSCMHEGILLRAAMVSCS